MHTYSVRVGWFVGSWYFLGGKSLGVIGCCWELSVVCWCVYTVSKMATSSRRLAVWMSVMLTVLLLCVGATWAMEAQGQGSLRRLDEGTVALVFQSLPKVRYSELETEGKSEGVIPRRPSLDGAVAALLYAKHMLETDLKVGFLGNDEVWDKIYHEKVMKVLYFGVGPDVTDEANDIMVSMGGWKNMSIYDHHTMIKDDEREYLVKNGVAFENGETSASQMVADMLKGKKQLQNFEDICVKLATFAEMESTEGIEDLKKKLADMNKCQELTYQPTLMLPYIVDSLEQKLGETCAQLMTWNPTAVDDVIVGTKDVGGVICIHQALKAVLADGDAVKQFVVNRARNEAGAEAVKTELLGMQYGGPHVEVLYAEIDINKYTKEVVFGVMDRGMVKERAKFFIVKRFQDGVNIYTIRRNPEIAKDADCLHFAKILAGVSGAEVLKGNKLIAELMAKEEIDRVLWALNDKNEE
eukprot:GHVS01002046.1.p1 GENE.GHVS01002046.1~~GHVS01002046.1.p1  ORF type:complete len:468 (+),score=61.41 GHVS01002046.1:37-1440(+)